MRFLTTLLLAIEGCRFLVKLHQLSKGGTAPKTLKGKGGLSDTWF